MDAVLEGDWEIDEEEEGEGKRRVRRGTIDCTKERDDFQGHVGPLSAQVPAPFSLPSMPSFLKKQVYC